MRLKQKMALLLSGVMLAGAIGVINPAEVKADPISNTFTLTVPGDTSITKSGWNIIGDVEVTNVSIDTGSKIEVTIEGGATGRTLKKSGETSKTVGYGIYKGSTSRGDAFGEKIEFTANGTQEIGAVVNDYSSAENGTYTDTINFTATLKEGISAENFPLSNSNAKVLRASDLLASKTEATSTYSTFKYNGATYTAYNGYIDDTAYANWDEAQAFVKLLNDNTVDGCTTWTLLTNEDMAFEWWLSTAESGTSNGQKSFGDVRVVWAGAESGRGGYYWSCNNAWEYVEGSADEAEVKSSAWGLFDKTYSSATYGFVVLRETEAPEADPVTYERADGETLSSADLGEPAEWEYGTTTYQVYNEFIPSSSGSGWNDAIGFVNALNEANYGGHSDWTLLSSDGMAKAWHNQYVNGKPLDRGYVNYLWSSVEHNKNNTYAFYLKCSDGNWIGALKSSTTADYGFVVLRGEPSDS